MTYNHALALNPYFRDSSATMGIFPPTGLEYIAASMKDLVGKVTLLDLRYEWEYREVDVLSEFIRSQGIDLLCISITWSSQFRAVCELISRLPPEITTVVGGHKATEEVELLFETCPNIDLIVRGEGEETIREIVSGLSWNDILGLSYRQNDEVIHNANRSLPDTLGMVFPDRSLRRHDYHWIQNGVQFSRLTFDTVLTTRGCPYNCKFCTFSLNPLGQKRKYAERSLESVMEELQGVTADVVMFSDENFFTNPKRSEELCDMIIASGIRKSFIVQTRIEIARNPSLLAKAEKAGFKVFLMGIESPHDRILQQINKGFTQQQVRDAFKILNDCNIYVHGYFIYGNIGETEAEMVYIAQFARELKLDSITFQKLRIEKYSPLSELVENTPGYHYDRVGGPVYSDKYGRAELKNIRNQIKFQFYTIGQVWRIIRKVRKAGLLTSGELVYILLRLPKILLHVGQRELQKRALRKRLKQVGSQPG